MKKETMDKLDKMNLAWLLENLSLGNLARGVLYIARSVEKCVACTAEKMKSAADEVEKKPEVKTKQVHA